MEKVQQVDHQLSETLLALSRCFHSASPRVGVAARLMPGLTKIMILVSQKIVLFPLKINIFKKIPPPMEPRRWCGGSIGGGIFLKY